jgi:hypothetical protein
MKINKNNENTYFVINIFIRAKGECSQANSSVLSFMIAKPFPVQMEVGITVGIAAFFVNIGIIAMVITRVVAKRKKNM